MDKLEHLALMLNKRTKGKKYENFVINSIYAKLSNPDLIPVTQQYVKKSNHSVNNKKKYYLLDLYFPQLKYGIEVDEYHHFIEENRILDEIRAEDILGSIQCEIGRISIYNEKNIPKTYDEVNIQINEQVKFINKLILDKKTATKKDLQWEDNEYRKKSIIKNGVFSIKDDVNYAGVTEIYNIIGNNVKNLGRCFVKLNNNYKLWVPYLAIQLEDGTVKTKNGWQNILNEDKTVITEVVGNMEKCDSNKIPEGKWDENGYKRIVFMHIRDSFGLDRVKFLGIYEAFKLETHKGVQTRFYKRTASEININKLKKGSIN